jgi:hypothetical protein
MRLPKPRGPLSERVIEAFAAEPGLTAFEGVRVDENAGQLGDEDLQLALYLCYELHYRSFEGIDPDWEWDPGLLALRGELERIFLAALTAVVAQRSDVDANSVGELLFELSEDESGPSLSKYLEFHGTLDQFREFAIHRSAYQLKEADPHSWAIPRLDGAPKSALVEVQADEYGGGHPDRIHSALFAKAMDALGLDSSYGAYLDRIPAVTLATVNLMSLFGLHRRWRGAIVGHLAMFEITSPVPNRRYGNGLRRLGLGPDALDFYDEHVEADSVHENIAAYDLAGGLAREHPELAAAIVFGAVCLLELEGRFAEHLLGCWERGESSLYGAVPLAGEAAATTA